jgi:CRISPR-associated protein Csb2
VFSVIDGLDGEPRPLDLSRVLRRAVMARVQSVIGERERLPSFFSGHNADGAPIRRSDSSHLAFAFDPASRRLLILAPHLIERRPPTEQEREYLHRLDVAVEGFRQLRAGSAGLLTLSLGSVGENREDSIFGHSRTWQSLTPYLVTRHTKGVGAAGSLAADVRVECGRLGLPEPRVASSNVRGVPGTGLIADIRLTFRRSVSGPLLLGRTRHLGGGLFQPVREVNEP